MLRSQLLMLDDELRPCFRFTQCLFIWGGVYIGHRGEETCQWEVGAREAQATITQWQEGARKAQAAIAQWNVPERRSALPGGCASVAFMSLRACCCAFAASACVLFYWLVQMIRAVFRFS